MALGGDGLLAHVGTVTQKNGTGTLAVTGVGFTPRALMFFGTSAVTLDAMNQNTRITIGFATGTGNRAYVNHASDDGPTVSLVTRRTITNKCVGTISDSSAGTLLCEADLASFDADGFTLDWTTADATLRKFFYLALA